MHHETAVVVAHYSIMIASGAIMLTCATIWLLCFALLLEMAERAPLVD